MTIILGMGTPQKSCSYKRIKGVHLLLYSYKYCLSYVLLPSRKAEVDKSTSGQHPRYGIPLLSVIEWFWYGWAQKLCARRGLGILSKGCGC